MSLSLKIQINFNMIACKRKIFHTKNPRQKREACIFNEYVNSFIR